tara:strand:- start:22 stop:354 length:333 start_codon:yes stop_codon:yes gene_type:complete
MLLIIKLGLMVAVIVLFISYYVYQYMYGDNVTPIFPPFTSTCPDYWEAIGDQKCRNVNKIGKCLIYNGTKDSDVMDFDLPIFKGKKGMYYKCSWAQKCGVPWEGISNLCA